jgi:hypothetical protein
MVVVDFDAILIFFVSGDSVPCASGFALEQVGQGDEFDTGIGIQTLTQGAVAAAAATEQPYFNLARALRVDYMRHSACQRRGAGGCGRNLFRFTFIFI